MKEGKFETGLFRLGVKSKGIDYAVDENNKALVTAEDKVKVEALREEIIKGKIQVPDYYLQPKKK
jgi:basic membrane protein A